jgi:hypothetical protein
VRLDRDPALAALAPVGRPRLERLVHPLLCQRWEGFSVRETLGLLPAAVKHAVARRLPRSMPGAWLRRSQKARA